MSVAEPVGCPGVPQPAERTASRTAHHRTRTTVAPGLARPPLPPLSLPYSSAMRTAVLLLTLATLTACGLPGVDCGPIPQPECGRRAEVIRQSSRDAEPGKTVWSIHLRADGADVIYTDGSGMSSRFD